ncbi:protein PFC0760c-like [Mytilus trossulus]|uniref:protein PFC0760c-like n=1 Tax=Mytilus trossulus TaxID=6551 RepID=UPI003006973F
MSGGRGDGRSIKEKTVLVDVGDNRNIKAADVIANVEKEVGEGTVLACVPKSGNSYELTLTDKDTLDLIVDTGFKVNDSNFIPRAIFSRDKVVIFFNVSHYVPDSEISEKLMEFGVILKSPIKRKMHPGTDVANGTRGENENETTNNDTENDTNANNSRSETNSDIPERETNTEQQENDGMKENEAGDEHTDGANGDVDNMEQSDDDDDNTAKSDGEDDDDTMEESNADDDAKDEQFDENAKKDNDVTVSDEKKMSGVDNDELDLMTDDEHSNKQETVNVDNKMHRKGGSSPSKLEPQPVPRGPNLTDTAGKKTKVNESKEADIEMTDEELAANMSKVRRKRLVSSPKVTSDGLKKLKREPKSKKSNSSS